MIDFRYHLVSIASVFLALAVGIVLGAGPLKGTIGDTLTSEVTRLRDDANELRADLSDAEGQLASRDEVIAELHPLVVEGLLAGDSVSLLVLPGASDASVEAAATSLADAGAEIPATIRLEPSWVSADPPDEADRTAAAGDLRQQFATEVPVGSSADEVIGLALGWALGRPPIPGPADLPPEGPIGPTAPSEPTVGPTGPDDQASPGDGQAGGDDGADSVDGAGDAGSLQTESGTGTDADSGTDADAAAGTDADAGTDGPTNPELGLLADLDERGALILEILDSHGLLSHDTTAPLGLGSGVVVVAPETAELDPVAVDGWTRLLTLLADADPVAVVGSVDDQATPQTQLILAIRDSADVSAAVSTLDNIDTPIGTTALPLILSAAANSDSDTEDPGTGHYGQLGGTAGLLPPLPAETP